MNSSSPNEKMKRISSIGITLIIVLILIFSGPASAVLVEISGLSSEPYTKGNNVDFQISITLNYLDKYVPITNFSLNLTGPTPNVWIFDTSGTVLPQDNGNITINGISVPDATNYGGPDFGYGVDENPGYGYGYGFDFPYGYGYGYGCGYNNGVGEGAVTYIYDVTLYTTNLVTGDYKVTASLNTGNETKPSFTSSKAEFSIEAAYVPPTNGGGGGGGGGAFGEDFENILISETEREYINKDSNVSYGFDSEGNIVGYINFTGLTGSGRIAAKVEMLNHTSTLADHAPQDIVYMNLNIWVGNLGWATSSNIANPTISFRVEKSWVTEQNIDESTINMYRYSDGKWNLLDTTKINEDADYLYFEAVTTGFSPFVVTGKKVSAVEAEEGGIVAKPTTLVEETSIQTPDEEKPGIPGFSLFAGLLGLLITMQLLRKKK